ncbi:(2Fe-2S) ferredoxin domain-containing protein [Alkalicella caledoniensis]|uniref:(2Fe-2S) ferredoxin domain-containing protein n=1 Tax=Alkalicella caledoniensis TaxID=2731377 RepID=UPI001FE4CE85|nr:(2Fe-2S) ferredoxin domain-containing protein [Alkalicella caledoniensis]
MSKIKSLEDLRRLRVEQERNEITRQNTGVQVIVGMGTCGIAAGARDAMLTILEEINKRNLKVNITQTGCIGMCQHEPLIDVIIPGEDRITYGLVTKDIARKIVAEHIVNNNIVKEAVIGRIEKQ